ncbi:hypothetical protein GN956_G10264 [Arapaima gigas]
MTGQGSSRKQQPSMASIEVEEDDDGTEPFFKQYHASEMLPSQKLPLHNLLQKQPMALGAVQVVCGFTSFGLGLILATASVPTYGTLLRVPIVIGILFFISGLLSFLLFKFSVLLPVSYLVNLGSVCMSLVGVVLLTVDLSSMTFNKHQEVFKVTALIVSVILLALAVTAVLLRWLYVEQRAGSGGSKQR